jgi:hypothetical protein
VKTFYDLLGLPPGAPSDDIKQAFRREIARYHPDKVHHLGVEFQEIAAVRAAELTEAYRILMDAESRSKYDASLADGAGPNGRVATGTPVKEPARPAPAQPETMPPLEPPVDRRFQQERATTSHFVRKAGLSRLRDAVTAAARGAEAISADGFDVAYYVSGKGGLFRKGEPPVRVLAKFVHQVDAAAVEASWMHAVKVTKTGEQVCVMLLGADGVSSSRDLSLAVSEQRRKTRTQGPILVPVDVRDWDALFPPDAPVCVRAILQWLQEQP